ncbi:MAG: hypothetical protein U5J83_11755 [Bryobacterales bacterium]|nr:hypothetical protein [Bryobacterales bacterium]
MAALLIAAVTKHLGAAVVAHHLHRWRYARPRYPLSVRSMQVQDSPSLMLAGDAFGGRDIESAILSGLAASEQLLAGATPRI